MRYFVATNEVDKKGVETPHNFVFRGKDGVATYSKNKTLFSKEEAQKLCQEAVDSYTRRKRAGKQLIFAKKWHRERFCELRFYIGKEK